MTPGFPFIILLLLLLFAHASWQKDDGSLIRPSQLGWGFGAPLIGPNRFWTVRSRIDPNRLKIGVGASFSLKQKGRTEQKLDFWRQTDKRLLQNLCICAAGAAGDGQTVGLNRFWTEKSVLSEAILNGRFPHPNRVRSKSS